MITNCLSLPFGTIQLRLNGQPIDFEYEIAEDAVFWDKNNVEVKPLGAINLLIDTKKYKVGSELYIFSSAGKLENDGGDENTVNAVAELEEYTYGIGGPDTECMEWVWENTLNNLPEASKCGSAKRHVALELIDMTSNGLKYQIVKVDENEKNDTSFLIPIVWESNEKSYAYDMVSCLTC